MNDEIKPKKKKPAKWRAIKEELQKATEVIESAQARLPFGGPAKKSLKAV